MNILNIHGFDGSCINSNYRILKSLNHNVISKQLEYRSYCPQAIYNQLVSIIEHTHIHIIVATSFGAFFGNRLSNQFDVPCIFTNPCFRPDVSLKAIAPGYFTEENCSQIESYVQDQMFYNYLAKYIIVGDCDEIIDHNSITLSEAKGATFYHVSGGKHQLQIDQYKNIVGKVVENIEKSNLSQ